MKKIVLLTAALIALSAPLHADQKGKDRIKQTTIEFLDKQYDKVRPVLTHFFFAMYYASVGANDQQLSDGFDTFQDVCKIWRPMRIEGIDHMRDKIDTVAKEEGLFEWRIELIKSIRSKNCMGATYDMWSRIDNLCPFIKKRDFQGFKDRVPRIAKKFSRIYAQAHGNRPICNQIIKNFK